MRPIGVDLPAMALSALAAAFWVNGYEPISDRVGAPGGCGEGIRRCGSPCGVGLRCRWWLWWLRLWRGFVRRPEMDPVTAQRTLLRVHDHPFRSSLEHHYGPVA